MNWCLLGAILAAIPLLLFVSDNFARADLDKIGEQVVVVHPPPNPSTQRDHTKKGPSLSPHTHPCQSSPRPPSSQSVRAASLYDEVFDDSQHSRRLSAPPPGYGSDGGDFRRPVRPPPTLSHPQQPRNGYRTDVSMTSDVKHQRPTSPGWPSQPRHYGSCQSCPPLDRTSPVLTDAAAAVAPSPAPPPQSKSTFQSIRLNMQAQEQAVQCSLGERTLTRNPWGAEDGRDADVTSVSKMAFDLQGADFPSSSTSSSSRFFFIPGRRSADLFGERRGRPLLTTGGRPSAESDSCV